MGVCVAYDNDVYRILLLLLITHINVPFMCSVIVVFSLIHSARKNSKLFELFAHSAISYNSPYVYNIEYVDKRHAQQIEQHQTYNLLIWLCHQNVMSDDSVRLNCVPF